MKITLFDPKFPQQKAFAKDEAKLKALFCTRRAAKSYTAGLYMVYEALTLPGCNCLFIGLTRQTAADIINKDILKVLNRKHKLGMRFNKSTLEVTFKNGSVIRVTGVDADEEEMNKLLGKKYRLVCIDEASMYTINVRHLVYDILGPAMTDWDGSICLFGTASNFTRGLFYDITTGKEPGWSLHKWSALDNPYVDWRRTLEKIKAERPLYMETPQFRQWYLNEWVIDEDKLVYKFSETRNVYKELPTLRPNGWVYVLGVDTGWEDDNAFVLTGYHENDPTCYVIKTFNKSHMTFDQVTAKVEEFLADKTYPISKVVIDGANKQGVESMRHRASIPFEYADKIGKVDFIEMMNGDLVQGKVKLQENCVALRDEMMSLVWVTEGEQIVVPKKEHPSLPNHLCDAFLYAWRNGFHYMHTIPEVIHKPGTKEYDDSQAQKLFDHHVQKIERERHLRENDGISWNTDRDGIAAWNKWGDD